MKYKYSVNMLDIVSKNSLPSFGLLMSPHGKPSEVLVLRGGTALHLGVTAAERVSQPLDLYRHNDEIIQCQLSFPWVKFCQEILYELRREPVAHLLECLGELSLVYLPTPVTIIPLKHRLPLVYVLEQLPEFVDVDGACQVTVKHVYHHLAGLLAELAHVPISQSLAQLLSINLSTVILIHCLEPLSNLGIRLLCRGTSILTRRSSSTRISTTRCTSSRIPTSWLSTWCPCSRISTTWSSRLTWCSCSRISPTWSSRLTP